MKSLFKRAGEAWRWARPYVTLITGGLFFWVGLWGYGEADSEPVSLSFLLMAVGLLIIGRANTLYRARRAA